MFQIDAREEGAFHIDNGHVAGTEGHTDSTCRRFGIEHGMDRDAVASRRWAFKPERPECREFFASGLGRLQGERPGDGPEILAPRDGAEEGCALNDGEIERLAVPIDRDEAETGEPDVA